MRESAPATGAVAGQATVSPSIGAGRAEVFGVGRIAGLPASGLNPFRGTQRITISQRGEFAPTLDLFAGQADRVQTFYDDATGTAIYLWGRASHEQFSGEALPGHVLRIVRGDRAEWHRLREILGHFVFILDNRRRRQVTFVSDLLGLRPWFVGAHHGRLVAGSDVLRICGAGFSKGIVDYDAVSCWLKYNFDVTGGSVVADYKSIAPGAITTVDATGQILECAEYRGIEYADRFAPREQMADLIHEAAAKSLAIQTRGLAEVNMPLSGGWDSRLLFALAVKQGLPMRAITMRTREYEVAIAKQVAATLKQPLRLLPSRRRILDLFDEPFAFNAAGFPTGRNLTNALAARFPGMPLVSGFMGDGVMRGPLGPVGAAYWAHDREKLDADELTNILHQAYTTQSHRFQLLRESVVRNLDQRAMQCAQALIKRGQAAGKPLLFADLAARHRLYFANIFLQHLDVCEAILPYHSFDVINLRTSYDQARCYGGNNYLDLFPRHYPQIAHIGHTSAFIPNASNKRVRPMTPASRHLRRFAAEVAAALVMTDSLEGAKRKRILSMLPDGLLGEPRFQEEIQFVYKLQLFERKLRRNEIRFDWNAI